jgi:hypothetical protein
MLILCRVGLPLLAFVAVVMCIILKWRMPYCPECGNRQNTYRAGLHGAPMCDTHGEIPWPQSCRKQPTA